MTATAASPRERRFLPRFSLRVLLLAVTAFAIGFPIWYRWPYEEEQVTWAKNAAGQDDYSRPPDARRVKTWQRQWGGGRVQHGEERYYIGGKLMEVQTYRTGKRHGPFRQFANPEGKLTYEGHYVQGKKQGAWRRITLGGKERSRIEYREGKMVRAVAVDKQGVEHVIEMLEDEGSTRILIGGIELEDRLQRLADEGRIDDKRLQESLRMPVDTEFVETPLREAVEFLTMMKEVPIVLDPHLPEPNRPIDGTWNDLPFSVALTATTGPSGHACDYRYGFLWVTTTEDAKDWHDPTGVADLAPPKDSQLAKSWNEPVNVNAFNKPLAEVLGSVIEKLAIDVDTSQLGASTETAPAHPLTMNLMGIKFQNALGMLLYQTRCRCKLEGETLVILPPEEMP